MRGPHNLWRLIQTGATFERTGAMKQALEAVDAPPAVRVMARVLGWPFQWFGLAGDPTQPPILRALTALGPFYIKFGQLMSTRPDIVGAELAHELTVLQDKLPPFSTEEARRAVEAELDKPVDEVFSSFSDAVAAASLAQVHQAILRETGETVAVKVLRPGIERAFMKDVDAFYLAAWLIETFAPFARRLRPRAVIEHFEGIVLGELDLRMEAAAANEFADTTKDDDGFRVPAVIWTATERRVLTLEWMTGINVGNIPALRENGTDLIRLSERILQTFLTHALRDGLFHGDMHQGNLKLGEGNELIALDFGIMGRIDIFTRRTYAEIIIGFLQRDYTRVAKVHFEAGYVPANQDMDAFAQALRAIGEPIFGQDATHISMARLLAHLFEVTERFGMETRTELILLQRTMVVVEGVARSLNPAMNMWETSRPVVTDYIASSLGPKAFAKDLTETMRILTRFGPRLPYMAEKALMAASNPPAPPERPHIPGWIWGLGGTVAGATLVALGSML